MPITDAEKLQLEQVLSSLRPGQEVVLIETTVRFTGERAVLMAFKHVSQGRANLVPFAEMVSLTDMHARYMPPQGFEEKGDPTPPASGETS